MKWILLNGSSNKITILRGEKKMSVLFFFIGTLALMGVVVTAFVLIVKTFFMQGRVQRFWKILFGLFLASFVICLILSVVLPLNYEVSGVRNDDSNYNEEVSDTKDINDESYNADTSSETTSKETTSKETTSKETTSKGTVDEEMAEKETSDREIGTRKNPYPFNTPVEMSIIRYDNDFNEFTSSLEITILSSERGESAYQKLMKANPFNEAAPKGYEWVLVKMNVAFTETDNENESLYFDKYNFELVSESGDIYSGNAYAVDPEPSLNFEMYVGNEKAGYAAYLVKEGENALLRYNDNDNFFAIE